MGLNYGKNADSKDAKSSKIEEAFPRLVKAQVMRKNEKITVLYQQLSRDGFGMVVFYDDKSGVN